MTSHVKSLWRRVFLLTILIAVMLSVAFLRTATTHTTIITSQLDGVTSRIDRDFTSTSFFHNNSALLFESRNVTLPETLQKDVINMLPVDKRLPARSKHIRAVCEREKTNIDSAITSLRENRIYSHFYAPQKRVIYHKSSGLTICIQAKGGSTFWKHFFTHLKTIGIMNRRIMYSQRFNSAGLKFQSLSDFKEQISQTDENMKMYVFARSPWDRLVSLYRQKLETSTPEDKEWKYMSAACLRLIVFDSFEAMLKCVLYTWKKHLPDRHWEPIVTRCDLCNIPYTYYGRLDTMNEEVEYIFNSWNINANIPNLITAAREGSMREVEHEAEKVDYREYYKNVSSETIAEIQKMYKLDIELFGFPLSPFV